MPMKIARGLLVFVASTAILLGGCTVIAPGHGACGSAGCYAPSTKKSKPKKGPTSIFSSWFRAEEPEPPRSPKEWMELEQIRP